MRIPISAYKALRIAKRIPGRAWVDWWGALANRGQLLSLSMAVLVSWVGLQTASHRQVVEEIDAWGNAVWAFLYVALGWAVICLLRAPFAVVADDRCKGTWYGGRFVYHEPKLVAVFLCKATGDVERYQFRFDDADAGSFVSCEVEMDGPTSVAKVTLGSSVFVGVMPYLAARKMGFRLGRDRLAELWIQLPPNAMSATVRVYCRSFTMGNPNDQDGTAGHLEPFRSPLEGDERGQRP